MGTVHGRASSTSPVRRRQNWFAGPCASQWPRVTFSVRSGTILGQGVGSRVVVRRPAGGLPCSLGRGTWPVGSLNPEPLQGRKTVIRDNAGLPDLADVAVADDPIAADDQNQLVPSVEDEAVAWDRMNRREIEEDLNEPGPTIAFSMLETFHESPQHRCALASRMISWVPTPAVENVTAHPHRWQRSTTNSGSSDTEKESGQRRTEAVQPPHQARPPHARPSPYAAGKGRRIPSRRTGIGVQPWIR